MIRVLHGDCRAILPTLPAASVHCVVTSPPYWGLRDYGVDGQIGLEPDFNAYVAAMVGVFREVRRVLRDDGTLWLNLGDSYAGGGTIGRNDTGMEDLARRAAAYGTGTGAGSLVGSNGSRPIARGLKPKDLCGIPWRVAFALQADGWYLRQDIIWSKPNPMPESVTDRCTKSHEYLFLLSKRERYNYDAEAIAEPNAEVDRPQSEKRRQQRLSREVAPVNGGGQSSKGIDDGWVAPSHVMQTGTTRNKRSVWEISTQSFSEAHFATFPPALIEPCIKAGTSEKGCCSKCGKPWARQTERGEPDKITTRGQQNWAAVTGQRDNAGGLPHRPIIELGWSPSCACAAETVSCTVLDPFAGAGTTGLVADRLQRNAILIELNPTYAAMGERRITDDAPLFAEIST